MTNPTRPGYEWWDRLCALPKYSFILGPAGNSVRRVEDKVGNWIEYPYAQAVVDDAQAEINQLRQIISDCAAAVGNGTGVGPTCSLDFMRLLPDEIRAAVTPTPAASGAAPANMRESLKWCAAALQAIGKAWAEHESSRFELVDTKESKSLSEILDGADAALASREARNASLVDDDLHKFLDAAGGEGLVLDGVDAGDLYVRLYPYQCGAALASPQVAPAPEPVAFVNRDELDNMLEDRTATIQGQCSGWRATALYLATPVQVAPTETAILQMSEWLKGHEFANVDEIQGAWEALKKLKSLVAAPVAPQPTPYVDSNPQLHVGESSFEDWYQNYLPNSVGHKQIARDAYAAGMGDPLVAPQDDARDAAIEDAIHELLCRWDKVGNPKNRDDDAWLRGYRRAKVISAEELREVLSTPAAKPTEEQGS